MTSTSLSSGRTVWLSVLNATCFPAARPLTAIDLRSLSAARRALARTVGLTSSLGTAGMAAAPVLLTISDDLLHLQDMQYLKDSWSGCHWWRAIWTAWRFWADAGA